MPDRTITMGDIENNFDQAVEDIRARRINEKDEYEKEILQKIEMAMQGIRIEYGDKAQYAKVRKEIARSVIGAHSAREVASKLSDVLRQINVTGEHSLEIYNISTSTLYHKEKEVEKLRKSTDSLKKEAKKLRQQKKWLVFWMVLVVFAGLWMLSRGG